MVKEPLHFSPPSSPARRKRESAIKLGPSNVNNYKDRGGGGSLSDDGEFLAAATRRRSSLDTASVSALMMSPTKSSTGGRGRRQKSGQSKIYDDDAVTQGYASVPLLDMQELPRGGISIETKAAGRIQFGIPPETIKDSMVLGLDVPRVYIVPMERFCRDMGPALGINLAEFEFPAYFNYFIRRKKCLLVVDSDEAERNIRKVFEETLLGPKQFRDESRPLENDDEDFNPDYPRAARPNFYREFRHFRVSEKTGMFSELNVDMLLDFCHFEDHRMAPVDGGKPLANAIGVPPTPSREIGVEENEEEEDDLNASFGDLDPLRKQPSYRRRSRLALTRSLEQHFQHFRSSQDTLLPGEERRRESTLVLVGDEMKDSIPFHDSGFSANSDTSMGEDEKNRTSWLYSRVRWLGQVATVWPMDATEKQIQERSAPRVEIFKMPGGADYIIHDVDVNNIIVGKAKFSGSVRIPDMMAVEGFLPSDMLIADSFSRLYANPTPRSFHPPDFGLTVLGNSHGFDKSGSTSGYVLWLNGRGIMIDPPPYSSATLEQEGIRPPMIFGIIVTHCHADHDAGAFQKVLTGSRVTIITTPTIYASFIKKYSALSGLNPDLLRHSHRFRPAIIGEPLEFQGATFYFTYTLHTIPCIGFKVEWRGRSMVFTGDHLNLPPLIDQLQVEGVLSPERAQSLKELPLQDCDVLLHEAGAPPIHTPLTVLQSLPEHVKRRLYVVHTSALPPDCGLRVAPTGTGGTIRLDLSPAEIGTTAKIAGIANTARNLGITSISHVGEKINYDREASPNDFVPSLGGTHRPACVSDAWFMLNLLSNVPFFSTLSYANAMEVLEIARIEFHPSDSVVVPAHKRHETLCVVWEGTCMERHESGGQASAVLRAGDWTGPMALQPNLEHSAGNDAFNKGAIVAVSDEGARVITLKMKDLEKVLVRGSKLYRKYLTLEQGKIGYGEQQEDGRALTSSHSLLQILRFNSVLGALPANQKRALEAIAEGPRSFPAGESLWRSGDRCDFAFLIAAGTARFGRTNLSPLRNKSTNSRRSSAVLIELDNGTLVELDKPLQNISPDSEYAKLESLLLHRQRKVQALGNNFVDLSENQQQHLSAQYRYANKVLARLYASRKYTSGLLFSQGCFLSDTSRMVNGELVHELSDALLQQEKSVHSSTMVAGSHGCIAWVFPRNTFVHFLDSNPGILLSLMGTQAVI